MMHEVTLTDPEIAALLALIRALPDEFRHFAPHLASRFALECKCFAYITILPDYA